MILLHIQWSVSQYMIMPLIYIFIPKAMLFRPTILLDQLTTILSILATLGASSHPAHDIDPVKSLSCSSCLFPTSKLLPSFTNCILLPLSSITNVVAALSYHYFKGEWARTWSPSQLEDLSDTWYAAFSCSMYFGEKCEHIVCMIIY